MVDSLTYMFYFVVVGMLCGIVWSLKFIVRLERKIELLDNKIERLLEKVEKEVEQEEKEIQDIKESEGVLDDSFEQRVKKL
ncbi:MAG: hypothetical protein KAJ54_02165 [Candidatus Aenigmarchaeota archaeon]|nr:hypothetical protein [Candidatus Aenigmarchaeota archaeon]